MTSDMTLSPGVWETVHAALAQLSKPFPTEALALADAHREEVAPHLVAELESLAADPSRVEAGSDYMLLDYAMHLLAWWRDPRGLQPLLALAQMRDYRAVYLLFGDHLDEALGRCLGSMALSHLQPLMALADDRDADVYARGAALDAVLACVIEGDASPEAVHAYVWDLAERVASEVTAQGSDGHLLDDVVSLAVDLGMSDMLPAIRGWLNQGLLHPRLSDLHKIEHKLAQPLEHRLQDLREGGHGYIRDPETEMAGWPCFKDRPARARQRVQCVTPPPREPAYIFSPPPPTRAQVRESPKIGRNDPCHCGSGKKYKKCHGAA